MGSGHPLHSEPAGTCIVELDSAGKNFTFSARPLPDGVTVAQQTLDLFVMVQIHVGQPRLLFFCVRRSLGQWQ